MNTEYVTIRNIVVLSLITNSRGETLVGRNPRDMVIIPGGIQRPEDLGSPYRTLQRSISRQVGKGFQFEHLQTEPLAQCVNAKTGILTAKPAPGDMVDLYYVYRQTLKVAGPQLKATGEDFRNPEFALPSGTFPRKSSNQGVVAVIALARDRFEKESMWPNFLNCLKDLNPFGKLEEQLKDIGFAPDVIAAQVKLNAAKSNEAMANVA